MKNTEHANKQLLKKPIDPTYFHLIFATFLMEMILSSFFLLILFWVSPYKILRIWHFYIHNSFLSDNFFLVYYVIDI